MIVYLLHQGVKKGDKGIAVLPGRWHGYHLIGHEVVSAEQVMPLLFSWRVNAFLRPPFHPTGTEDRMQA